MSKILRDSEQVLSNQELGLTMAKLETCYLGISLIRERIQSLANDRGSLLKRKLELETEISIAEAEALMNITGDGKDAHVAINGEKVPMTNDTSRKAYRDSIEPGLRRELAKVSGDLASIDADRFRLMDELLAFTQELEAMRAKANLQASLLQYMSRETVDK